MSKKTLIDLLTKLEDNWDDDYLLFSSSGTLMLVHWETREILKEFKILNDGGDPGTITKNGKLYLNLVDPDVSIYYKENT